MCFKQFEHQHKISKMNIIFLLFFCLFLFIRSDAKPKCRSYSFKRLLDPKYCQCNNITHSPMGRIFNGTTLDFRDLPYVVSIYEIKTKLNVIFDSIEEDKIYCTGAIISPSFVLT